MASKKAILKTKIENEIVELLLKTGADNVWIDETTTLAAKLAEIIATLNEKAKATDVTREISEAISALIGGAPETYDTLKEISDYIASHEDVVTALNEAIGGKVSKEEGKGLSANDFTTALKTKLEGIAAGAEVNQNAFSNVTVGDVTLQAKSKTDTVHFVAGDNVELTPNAVDKSVTVKVNLPTYENATQEKDGFMSKDDKKKLDGVEAGANKTVVDGALSDSSANPVQNKVVKAAFDALPNVKVASSQPTMKNGDLWIDVSGN